MAKKVKKSNYKLIAGIVTLVIAIGIVGVFGTIKIGKAQIEKSKIVELTELANSLDGNVIAFQAGLNYLSGGMLGARQSDIASGFWDVYVENDLTVDGLFGSANGIGVGTVGTDGAITEGYIEKIAVIDLTATNTGTFLNPEGEFIWVYDATYRIAESTTTAYRVVMGTTSDAIIDASAGWLAVNAGSSGGQQSILDSSATAITTSSQPNRATTTLFKLDYPGVDTRDDTGIQSAIPVASGEYLSCYATTSDDLLNLIGGPIGGKCQFKYYVIED